MCDSPGDGIQKGDADSYQCQECGACFNTILERWTLPGNCWRCGERRPWEYIERVEYVRP